MFTGTTSFVLGIQGLLDFSTSVGWIASLLTMAQQSATVGKPVEHHLVPLPAFVRFYIYGIQGFCDEIIFTSLFDLICTGSLHLRGHSALSSFLIYGSCSFFVERLYVEMWLRRGIRQSVRVPVYLICVYTWEFMFGLILRQFDACPWDYSHYRFNCMGLITLEYAPGWLVLCLVQDVIADYLLRLRVCPYPPPSADTSSCIQTAGQQCERQRNASGRKKVC